ncbi:DUF7551 domain-containing protein [Haladaptatus salinisoli]|uniref:DUF7551 domain-containing protein n=1 Tax=Haladaptatus salinisoli TaxID=2884876 RepID=UPI001D0BDF86|nr:hypothetical protein [Haladaptatus salinisoli]
MVGTTLRKIREHIETLASADGEYYLICGRTGERPIPAAEKRFDGRATAQSAARATEQYRAALRQYDPQLPYYDVIACQVTDSPTSNNCPMNHSRDDNDWTLTDPVLNTAVHNPSSQDLIEFCHHVTAAVFETLSDTGYDTVETAVMDTYFDLAETIANPDHLCLCLLESMSTELDTRLTPTEQADILAQASARLGSHDATDKSLTASLTLLQERGLLGSYTRSPWSIDLDAGARSVVVKISDYALSPQYGRLPVLPFVLDLYRRQPDWPPSSLQVVDNGGDWKVTLVHAREAEPTGLVSAPIHSKV